MSAEGGVYQTIVKQEFPEVAAFQSLGMYTRHADVEFILPLSLAIFPLSSLYEQTFSTCVYSQFIGYINDWVDLKH